MDALDEKLLDHFDGKAVRKDLLHRIKKGTNVPTFVLEFLLARFCASDDEDEIQEGLAAVLETLNDNYVRPDEANAAQSKVATKGKHKFIDKVHVRYVEKEKRHWASLENFNSQRIAIGEKFYKNNDRLLEGGIWAEVTLCHNDIEGMTMLFMLRICARYNSVVLIMVHIVRGEQSIRVTNGWILLCVQLASNQASFLNELNFTSLHA